MVAAGLLIASIAAPADLPGPLDALAPAPPAEAATGTVIAGTPQPCSAIDPDPDDSSTEWRVEDGTDDDDRECVLTADAVCPANHVKPAAGNPPPYLCYQSSCSAAFDVNRLGDYLIPRPGDDTSRTDQCRVFQVTECRAGIGPTHEGRCRYVQRRSWDCDTNAGYKQHNRFNTCYKVHPAAPEETPPPCDSSTGAPSLPLLDCDDYAGDDYDNRESCTDISSHLTIRSGGAAAAYWCGFDASKLSVFCHRNPVPSGADCEQSTGVCLKRASTTPGQELRALGGCYAIARNIKCAIHQANYADQVGTRTGQDALDALASNIRADRCEPCRVMPFEPLDSSQCPDSVLTGTLAAVDLSRMIDIQTINFDQFTREISDQLAQLRDVGISRAQGAAFQTKQDAGPGGRGLRASDPKCQKPPPGRLTWSTPSFTGLAMVNTRVRLEITWDFDDVSQAPVPSLYKNSGLGLCFVKPHGQRPLSFYLSVAVEPLWPAADPADSNESDDECLNRCLIEKLFGSGSLQWWDDLSAAEQTNHTSAFYANTDIGTVDVPCSLQIPIWCIWEPQQAGYYSLTATGALFMDRILIGKNTANTESVPDDWHSQITRETLVACTNEDTTCQFLDNGSVEYGVYIDGEPIGIQVHEVRVVSRTPSS